MIEKYTPGKFSVGAGSMMLKYSMINLCMSSVNPPFNPGDKVNVYINLESVLNNLFLFRDWNTSIEYHKERVALEVESSILNLVGHYKAFFDYKGIDVKVFLYMNDLEKSPQEMEVYNKFYREYYYNKYMVDPKFSRMGELMKNVIIPEVKLILTYIPDCYLITSTSFDSSVIPKVITDATGVRGVVVSADLFDSLYMFNTMMTVLLVRRHYHNLNVASNVEEVVKMIIKRDTEMNMTIFANELYYRLLLSVRGSKIRNIKAAKWFGFTKLLNAINVYLEKGIVLSKASSLESIIEIFPPKYREDIRSAFECTSIDHQVELMSDADKEMIMEQIIDKTDLTSVEALNNQRFLEFPINLQNLIPRR